MGELLDAALRGANVGLNFRQAVELRRIRAMQQGRMVAAQEIEEIRSLAFRMRTVAKKLVAMVDRHPVAVRAAVRLMRRACSEDGIEPDRVPDLSDKEYLAELHATLEDIEGMATARLDQAGIACSDRCARYLLESWTIAEGIEAAQAGKRLRASEKEWQALSTPRIAAAIIGGTWLLASPGLCCLLGTLPLSADGGGAAQSTVAALFAASAALATAIGLPALLIYSVSGSRYKELREARRKDRAALLSSGDLARVRQAAGTTELEALIRIRDERADVLQQHAAPVIQLLQSLSG